MESQQGRKSGYRLGWYSKWPQNLTTDFFTKCFILDPYFKNTWHSVAIIKINVPTIHKDINWTVGEEVRGALKKSTVMSFTDYIPNNILVFFFIIQHFLNKKIKI